MWNISNLPNYLHELVRLNDKYFVIVWNKDWSIVPLVPFSYQSYLYWNYPNFLICLSSYLIFKILVFEINVYTGWCTYLFFNNLFYHQTFYLCKMFHGKKYNISFKDNILSFYTFIGCVLNRSLTILFYVIYYWGDTK